MTLANAAPRLICVMADTDKIRLTCKACAASWEAVAPSGVSRDEWIAALETLSCPECGAAYRLASVRHPGLSKQENDDG